MSGEVYAAITLRKPITVEVRIAHIGTPRPFTRTSRCGASLRSASTNSIREAV